MPPLKLKKSAGIPVTGSVHRLIRRGNEARDRQDWNASAAAYRAVLETDPALRHIWIQLGHMLKETRRTEEAIEAYRMASSLLPDDPEPLVHIAHLHKARGDTSSAAEYFISAVRVREHDAASLHELQVMVGQFRMIDAGSLSRAARHLPRTSPAVPALDPVTAKAAIDRVLSTSGMDDAGDAVVALRSASAVLEQLAGTGAPSRADVPSGVVFDVTDLIGHFRHHRLPTGIQRVQIEVVMRALQGATDVRVCCFLDGRDCLVEIPGNLFVELARLASAGNNNDAPEWTTLAGRLFLHLVGAGPFTFRQREKLVNLGTSWWIYNYYLIIRNAKRDFGIIYIPFVHDLIPIMAADYCVTGVIEDYVSWLVGVFDHADHFLVNSESTGRDLMLAADRLGRRVDPATIEIVPLDADFRQPAEADLMEEELLRWNLSASDYCLIVSTIEARKNHVLALDAWTKLIEVHGVDQVPMLVCVGRSGWMNGAFFERLKRDPRLRGKVKLIERVSDEELALLYRSCRFTIYPSHYEGWGLPVTEALCYGRVPVTADNSSLREAGGTFALFFESDTVADLVTALEKMLFESGVAERLEREVGTHFRPRSWASITGQIIRAIANAGQNDGLPPAPQVTAGRYYPTALYKGTRIWPGLGSGEIFRSGTGWLWPDTDQSRITAKGATLRMQLAGLQGPFRLFLRLRGLNSKQSAFVVSAGGRAVVNGNLRPGEERWVLGNILDIDAGVILTIQVRGGSTEEIEMMTGGTPKRLQASIGVVGFAVLEHADEAERIAFVEKVALEGLDAVDAYGEELAAA